MTEKTIRVVMVNDGLFDLVGDPDELEQRLIHGDDREMYEAKSDNDSTVYVRRGAVASFWRHPWWEQ